MYEQDYLNLVARVMSEGTLRKYRNGNAWSIFGGMLQINSLVDYEFPILTTRKMSFKPIMGELSAFVAGATDLQTFKDFGCNYWDMNAEQWSRNTGRTDKRAMSVGVIYGAQWRNWEGCFDQLKNLVAGIKHDPTSRRHIMTAWNPCELDDMCLPPCHILVQAYVSGDYLDLSVYMRSVDMCLGLPTDVVLYAGFLVALVKECRLQPGSLIFQLGDMHIYAPHMATALEQINRVPWPLPTHKYEGSLFATHPDDFELVGYHPQEALKYELL